MKLYNCTNQVQELRVIDRASHRYHSIYVMSHSMTEIPPHVVPQDLPRKVAAGIFQVVDAPAQGLTTVEEVLDEPVMDPPAETSIAEDVTEETPVEGIPEESELSDTEVTKFVCDICGGEFASARSLNMHKRKHNS